MNLTSCIKGGSSERQPGWLIEFNYDMEFILELKKQIPHTGREWNPDTKTWWVSEDYEDVLTEKFGDFYAFAKLQGTLL